jgi:hypothetical protein
MNGGAVSGNSSYYGGGVYVASSGTITMNDGAVSGNSSSYGGGGVYVYGGTFTMRGGAVSGNSSSSYYSSYGGGVYVASSGTFTMNDGAVSGNSSSSYGGGVYVASSGTFAMNGGAVSGNSSSYGGGVFVEGGTFTMRGGAVSGNSSSSYSSYGGGVYVYGGTFTMNDGAVSGNSSSYYGGGVYVASSGTFTMNDGAVSGNSSSSYGGGVFVNYGTFTMSGGAVSGNSSSSGGGVYSGGTFTMNDGAVSGNSSTSGGGVYVASSGTFTMSGGAVSGNLLSGANSYAREVFLNGTFKISGSARPERIFLANNARTITIAGSLSGEPIAVDLDITGGALADWVVKPILRLDSSYSQGNMASLKDHFTLENATLTTSPYTETPITGYRISDTGLLMESDSDIVCFYDGAWTLQPDGRRKSPSPGDGNVTKSRISITSTAANQVITIQLDVSSEKDYDYAFISTLDNSSATYSSGYFTGSNISGETSVTVTIPVPTVGSHFIDIGYRKDAATSAGSDCAWFKVIE